MSNLKCSGIAWQKVNGEVMPGKCTDHVTHIDEKGFVYCNTHGMHRQGVMRCRKLKAKELGQLESGKPLTSYKKEN
jgi:hypothetical protein